MIITRQRAVRVDLGAAGAFVRRLRKALRLGRREFDVCFVSDRAIRRLNAAYRGKDRATDVLSFPGSGPGPADAPHPAGEFRNFLGDVIISAPTARRHARREGHSIRHEIAWLILHGVLHLLGYDHETDEGEMTARELSLREQLGVAGRAAARRGARKRQGRAA